MPRNELLVCFEDMWAGFNPSTTFLLDALRQNFEVAVSPAEHAEVCFFSVFGVRHEVFNGVKIQLIGEPVDPLWNFTDYAIGSDHIESHRYLRYPNWAWDTSVERLLAPLGTFRNGERPEFCLFLYSNPGSPVRNAIFDSINDLRAVTSPGRVRNNAPSIGLRHAEDWTTAKVSALRSFRFCIAAENQQRLGYTTEKLTDSFFGGAVPIYWGDPLVQLDFDTRTFINLASFGGVRELAEYVVRRDDDPSTLHRFFEHAPLTRHGFERTARIENVETFLLEAISKSRREPSRREWRRRSLQGHARRAARISLHPRSLLVRRTR